MYLYIYIYVYTYTYVYICVYILLTDSASRACLRLASSIKSPPIRRISRPHSLT